MEITENEILQRRVEIARKKLHDKNQKLYEKRLEDLYHCEVCKVDFDKYYLDIHLKTKKHILMQQGKKTNLKLCECCSKYVALSYWKEHIKTDLHKKNSIL